MMLVRVLLVSLCWTLGVLTAAPALAQESPTETEARSVFTAGQVAFSDGRYADALGYFQRAYELSHRPALLFNLALCEDRLRDDDAAIEHYERYIAEVPTAPNRREVDDRLEALHAARARRLAAAQAVQPANIAQAAGTVTGAGAGDATHPAHVEPVGEGVLTPSVDAHHQVPLSQNGRAGADVRRAAGGEDAGRAGAAFYETWWFWTIVGVVVVGGSVGIGVAMSGDAPLPQGDLGGVVFTLGSSR